MWAEGLTPEGKPLMMGVHWHGYKDWHAEYLAHDVFRAHWHGPARTVVTFDRPTKKSP